MSIELFGLEDIPIIDGDSDISIIIKEAIEKQGCNLVHGDIILIAETLISKAEENFIRLDELTPSAIQWSKSVFIGNCKYTCINKS